MVKYKEFQEWLKKNGKKAGTISSLCSKIRKIESAYDIEAEYAKDKCADLLYDFTYTEIEYDVGILPRVKLQMEETEAVQILAQLKSALKTYVKFLDECSK